ncbi:Serpentine Receptor, class H [Caenorhabditis elegans]|uniref:Serpentine Receptor, class H n=1 Tax=Caenorhabditis elegans TaxID=6239 RepID=Q7YTT7_CAEEL|nr:Serpentine Receptor, class H [Caenorhabditis elegans]CAE11296.1 Serpentine Receptor, class H [Caenorhabditis elegans]|eukprot:NP_001023714.1 Serpentine Receptor, class H [Caenorhabditis elegans]
MLLSALSSPYIYSNVLFVIAVISLPVHLFGCYCILFKTPEVMKSVKWSLFNVHIWTSLMDVIMSFFAQPFLSAPFVGFPMGVLHCIGVDTAVHVFIASVIAYLMPVSIICLFENRFYILFASKTFWRYARHPIIIIDYILAIAIPLFIICIPFVVNAFLPMFSADVQGTTNLICIIVSMHGVLSTLVMVHLQKAYREEFLRILGCRTTKIEENGGGVVATL